MVEDDVDLRDQLVFLLRNRGCRVETADNGEQALMLLHVGALPGLILLDLMMPVMDGWTFRAKTLLDPRLAAIPLALLSGVNTVEAESRKLKVEDYIGKPVDLVKLYSLIERLA